MEHNNFITKSNSNSLKGIAAICVILSHVLTPNYPILLRAIASGHLWVALFFFYSGYGLSYSLERKPNYLKNFIFNKFTKIYVPFAFAELIYILTQIYVTNNNYNLNQIALGVTGIYLFNTTLWYIIEILILYLLFFIINKIFKLVDIKNICWIVLYIIFVLFSVYFDIGTWWYTSTSCFLIGLFYGQKDSILHNMTSIINFSQNRTIKVIYIILFICFHSIFLYLRSANNIILGVNKNHIQVLLCLIVVILFLSCINTIVGKKNLNNKILAFLGNLSFEIYLYHFAVKNILDNYLPHGSLYNVLAIIICTIFFAFIIKYGYSIIFKKIRDCCKTADF